eukprot:6274864-Prymnesium_polylepis.2
MLRCRHDIARAGAPEERHPAVGVEALGTELGDEVLVAEIIVRPVRLPVVAKLVAALHVHEARVPLRAGDRTCGCCICEWEC